MGPKTFSIITFGCKVNQYDSQVIREQFLSCGLKELDSFGKDHLRIINTCTVTHKSERQARSVINRTVRENPQARLVVTGCYAHADSLDLKAIRGVDLVVNNNNKFRIAKLLGIVDKSRRLNSGLGTINSFAGHSRAFLKIQDGCDNFCSYCKVPYVRGRPRSKKPALIRQEIVGLLNNGFKEIVLCGVCLGSYGKDLTPKIRLSRLLQDLISIEGKFRFRLSSIEAKDITNCLIGVIAKNQKICRHLHIPFQSGDGKILKLMDRESRIDKYISLVERIRENIPGIAITTDIMLGFPGEEDSSFRNTVDFLKMVRPSRMHIFNYSPRNGTKAFNFSQKIPDSAVLKQRQDCLNTLARDFSFCFRNLFLNKVLDILIESKASPDTGFRGYSDNYIMTQIADYNAPFLADNLLPVRITKVDRENTYGVPVSIR